MLYRIYVNRPESEQMVILCSLFSVFMVGFRIVYTGNLLFIFLIWNLFLAFVPYMISKLLARYLQCRGVVFFPVVFVWLLFIPNTFYIITDLFHLNMNEDVPLWYDLALILSFVWSGLLLGVLSVREMQKIIAVRLGKSFEAFFVIPVMFLNGLGIYVGRYLRFNSWDIVADPFGLTREMIYLFVHPLRNRIDWSMILCYGVLVGLIYITFNKLGRSVATEKVTI